MYLLYIHTLLPSPISQPWMICTRLLHLPQQHYSTAGTGNMTQRHSPLALCSEWAHLQASVICTQQIRIAAPAFRGLVGATAVRRKWRVTQRLQQTVHATPTVHLRDTTKSDAAPPRQLLPV